MQSDYLQKRKRLKNVLNQIGFIVLVIGIFFKISIFDVSLIVLAIFIWIISGPLATIVYPSHDNGFLENCPSCGMLVSGSYDYCMECGASLKMGTDATGAKIKGD